MSLEPLSKASKVPRETTNLKRSDYTAAIDFGTSSLSLAYTIPYYSHETKILILNEKYERVPNAILIKKIRRSGQCSVEEIGHNAQTEYSKLKQNTTEIEQYIYFERIKMLLERDETVNRDSTVPSFTGGNYYLREVIAFIIKHLKDVLLHQLRDLNLKASDFDWVITVPAIWKARARRMMREAAYLAGLTCDDGGITKFTDMQIIRRRSTLTRPMENDPHKLTLALEPEAAAIHVHAYQQKGSAQRSPPPDRYMVVDIGGGTVDITVHDRSDGKINVILPPIGNACGGTTVNEALSLLIEYVVDDIKYQKFLASHETAKAALNQLYYQEFEEQKKKFGHKFQNTFSPTEEAAIILPRSFVKFYGEQRITEGCQKMGIECDTNDILRIKYSLLKEKVFQMTIDGIIRCVRDGLQQVHGRGVNTLYLVGGFGGCQFVERQLRNDLGDTINMICPQQADLAVTIGAVMWRQDPDIIQSRIADATYGIGTTQLFNPLKHDRHYFYVNQDGEECCRDILMIIATKGEVITKNEVYKTSVIPSCNAQTQVSIPIYSMPNGTTRYTKDKSGRLTVNEIGELIIYTPNPDNKPKNKRHIDITIDFSGTEIQATAKYRINDDEVKIICDFLSFQDLSEN